MIRNSQTRFVFYTTLEHTLLMMLKTRGSAPYLTAACDKERENSQRNRNKRDFGRFAQVLHHFWSISGGSDFHQRKRKQQVIPYQSTFAKKRGLYPQQNRINGKKVYS